MIHLGRREVLLLGLLVGATRLQAQRPAIVAGTYELSWFTQNTLTGAPQIGRLVLVLAAAELPKSLRRRMEPTDFMYGKRPPIGRACWRVLDGSIPMGGAKPTVTDWKAHAGDTVSVNLWFSVDAGSSLRLWADSLGVRGEAASSGWMASPPEGRGAPRVLRDSVLGRRVGAADPSRCLPSAP
jgi:hypothetical protein